jgi:hypothetical protein
VGHVEVIAADDGIGVPVERGLAAYNTGQYEREKEQGLQERFHHMSPMGIIQLLAGTLHKFGFKVVYSLFLGNKMEVYLLNVF